MQTTLHLGDEAATEARRWLLRHQEKALSAASLASFQAWMTVPKNRAAYENIKNLWASFARLPALKGLVHIEDLDKFSTESKPNRRFFHNGNLFKRAVWLSTAALAASLTFVFLLRNYSPVGELSSHRYATALQEVRTIELTDGSEVVLGAGSNVVVRYSNEVRSVILNSGEAFFTVVKDARRPFVVTIDQKSVRAVGTKFEVRRRAAEVRVAVTEGIVEVVSIDNSKTESHERILKTLVRAGQRLVASSDGSSVAVRSIGGRVPGSWREGRVFYEEEPLGEVIADIRRYSQRHISIESPKLARLAVTGSFRITDVESFLNQLDRSLPVEIQRNGDGISITSDSDAAGIAITDP
jgi:transmembrane sensor